MGECDGSEAEVICVCVSAGHDVATPLPSEKMSCVCSRY